MNRQLRFRLIAFVACAAALTAAHHRTKTETVMVETAQHFLNSLTADQKATASMEFSDEKRLSWHFVPDNSYLNQRGFARPAQVIQLRPLRLASSPRP